MKNNKLAGMSDFDNNIIGIMNHMHRHSIMNNDMLDLLKDMMIDRQLLLLKNIILEEKLVVDVKTNLLRPRDDYLAIILKAASRMTDIIHENNYDVTFIRFDIDDFSQINNRFGHDKGDVVLVDFSKILKENSRPTDYLVRFGGEEFDVILPATTASGGEKFLDKLFSGSSCLKLSCNDTDVNITFSAGMSTESYNLEGIKKMGEDEINQKFIDLQTGADNALYDAKHFGKNCYKKYNPSMDYSKLREKYTEHKLNKAP